MAKEKAQTNDTVPPKLMEGFLYSYDLNLYEGFSKKVIIELKENQVPLPLNRGNIIPNPKYKNEIVIFDIVQSVDVYPGSFRGFLYKDDKVMGKLKVNSPTQGVLDINGTYKKLPDGTLILKCTSTGSDGGRDGFYVELKR
jgi:hypothetical protein